MAAAVGQLDQRVRVNQIMASGGPEVKRRRSKPWTPTRSTPSNSSWTRAGTSLADRPAVRVNQINVCRWTEVKKAAQQALDANSPGALSQFLNHDCLSLRP